MSVAQPIDVRDMRIIHATFRSVYDESARLLRANPTPSPQRVTFLADHVDFGLQMLHHHHESEDELLYPLLEERVPEQAERTEQIDHEHLQVATAIDAALRDRPIGRVVSSPALRCQQTVGPLVHHLGTTLELHEALAEGARVQHALALLDECIAQGTDAVLCSHGDVIPQLLDALAARGVAMAGERECKKGSVWDLHIRDGRVERAVYTAVP